MSDAAQLSELERYALAYFLAHEAGDFSMDPRFFPTREIMGIFEGRIKFAISDFGITDRSVWDNAARAFVESVIAGGGFSTTESSDSVMHRYERARYQECVARMRAADPIIAQADGDGFWEKAFKRLTR